MSVEMKRFSDLGTYEQLGKEVNKVLITPVDINQIKSSKTLPWLVWLRGFECRPVNQRVAG